MKRFWLSQRVKFKQKYVKNRKIVCVCVLSVSFQGMGAFNFKIVETSLTQHC